jgi:predicted ABC-type ATPase
MIAGPNGSGKSTIFDLLRTYSFPLGYLQNPDLIERELMTTRRLHFAAYGLNVEARHFEGFLRIHPLFDKLPNELPRVQDNSLHVDPGFQAGYFVTILCDFMRRQWIDMHETFTFETVMSSDDKIQVLKDALSIGYRTYLYYMCTESPLINRERIANRVAVGGHDVPGDRIEARYTRSLDNLLPAIQQSSRAYLFDNSGEEHRLIAEFDQLRMVQVAAEPPGWFIKYVLDKLPTEET